MCKLSRQVVCEVWNNRLPCLIAGGWQGFLMFFKRYSYRSISFEAWQIVRSSPILGQNFAEIVTEWSATCTQKHPHNTVTRVPMVLLKIALIDFLSTYSNRDWHKIWIIIYYMTEKATNMHIWICTVGTVKIRQLTNAQSWYIINVAN